MDRGNAEPLHQGGSQRDNLPGLAWPANIVSSQAGETTGLLPVSSGFYKASLMPGRGVHLAHDPAIGDPTGDKHCTYVTCLSFVHPQY